VVVAAVALVAGADTTTALRLGLAMVALQVSIGALNDRHDALADAGRTPPKPIPVGLVSGGAAGVVVVVGAVVGLVLSAPSGLVLMALAVVVLGIGYAYDLVAKGTTWSWVPFAVGIPLLPVFGWLGTTGSLPSSFVVLVPAGVVAGTGLAIANARADMERDSAAGVRSVATRLGAARAWSIQAVLLLSVIVTALSTLTQAGIDGPPLYVAVAAGLVVTAGIVIGRSDEARRRERGWEVEAVGVALLATAWLTALPASVLGA
jgi:4-hydroxybenzoate polyprenyltransferase